MQFVLLFLAIIPVVIILTYIYRKDKNKEPGGLLVTLFIMGIISCFMVLAISHIMNMIFPFMAKGTEHMTFFEVMAYAFIGVALVEEFSKFFMTYLFSYRHKSYDEVYDGIVYAVFVSLGFAFFENILYVLSNQSISVGIARGILAVPGHACDAVFMGYYLSVAKVYTRQKKKKLAKKNLVLSVLAPTILHGIYDFCLFTGKLTFVILFLVFVVFMYIGAIKKIKQLAGVSNSKNKHHIDQNSQTDYQGFTPQALPNNFNQPVIPVTNNAGFVQTAPEISSPPPTYPASNGYVNMNNQTANRFCPSCGSPVDGDFCRKCGTRQS